jgi:hypothetical protein
MKGRWRRRSDKLFPGLDHWLNQQPDKIAKSWPAKPLISALQTAYADKKLTEAELEELANTIVAIEELWRETFAQSRNGPAADASVTRGEMIEENKPEAPSIPITAEMPADGRSDTFSVDLQHHTCNCPEWIENRGAFPEKDYRRCCVHLTRAFHSLVAEGRNSLRRDPLFVAVIEEHAAQQRGGC